MASNASNTRARRPSGAGHLFAAMGQTEDYLSAVGQLIEEVKTTPLAPATEILYPGELEDRNAQNNLNAGGIVLPDQTRADLEALGAQFDVPVTC
jgi:LDH2 family malate/lactate/ureidoglycolate dehydrogenase